MIPDEPTHELEAQRRRNRDAAASLGFEPYGRRTDGLIPIARARGMYDPGADAAVQAAGRSPPAGFVDPRPRARVAGRVMLHRDNGKLVWMNLRDDTGDVQVAVSQKDCTGGNGRGFDLAKATDLGDVLTAAGRVTRTRTGEITVWAEELDAAAKCLVPPPEKHAGLHDIEIRYRRRYVDLWSNPETLGVLTLRSRIVARMRRFMEDRGFLEVETPMLQTLAGGAAARPFVTHMNALGLPLFMRIAPELYLKRLLVGGLPRVFEINRNFRNEGLDKQHNPEFTMLEAYQAFGDVETVMELTESLVRDAAAFVRSARDPGAGDGGIVLPFGDLRIDYARPFERVGYGDLFARAYGFEMTDVARARAELARMRPGLAATVGRMDDASVVNELFEDKERGGEARLDPSRPTFITGYPSAISPLTRPSRVNPAIADRADLFIAGMEIAPHYTELNDPDVQAAKFREQLRGADAGKSDEESTFRTFDEDFIRALKVGMPPAGGMGLGVDRLVMILTDQRTIRDVILFPLMRPEGASPGGPSERE
ncbi:MAG: lysine--tRNA ligase [Phycisphaerae bacterium]|nr:lysine--tRNA ligase [Phycisphaerae bacterium]